jgi:hypothetical protein
MQGEQEYKMTPPPRFLSKKPEKYFIFDKIEFVI